MAWSQGSETRSMDKREDDLKLQEPVLPPPSPVLPVMVVVTPPDASQEDPGAVLLPELLSDIGSGTTAPGSSQVPPEGGKHAEHG
jgi:hypothetical protein